MERSLNIADLTSWIAADDNETLDFANHHTARGHNDRAPDTCGNASIASNPHVIANNYCYSPQTRLTPKRYCASMVAVLMQTAQEVHETADNDVAPDFDLTDGIETTEHHVVTDLSRVVLTERPKLELDIVAAPL
jgi:hypothetical protein